jgi:hypothetical protein
VARRVPTFRAITTATNTRAAAHANWVWFSNPLLAYS